MERLKLVKPSKEYEQEALEYINEFYKYNSDIYEPLIIKDTVRLKK